MRQPGDRVVIASAGGDHEWRCGCGSTTGRTSYAAAIEALARRKDVPPITSIDELRADVWEFEELLADLTTFRHEPWADLHTEG